MMFTIPCSTDECAGLVAGGRTTCDPCHDRNGYPAGYSRTRDVAWLNYRPCSEVRVIPVMGSGCNAHPVTPRPDVCIECPAQPGSQTNLLTT